MQFTLQLPAELKNDYAKRESIINWIFRVQGAEESGKPDGPSPAISQTTAPKTGLADPNVWMPLGFAAITAFGTAKLSRNEKKRGGKTVKRWRKVLSGLLMAALIATGIALPENICGQ